MTTARQRVDAIKYRWEAEQKIAARDVDWLIGSLYQYVSAPTMANLVSDLFDTISRDRKKP